MYSKVRLEEGAAGELRLLLSRLLDDSSVESMGACIGWDADTPEATAARMAHVFVQILANGSFYRIEEAISFTNLMEDFKAQAPVSSDQVLAEAGSSLSELPDDSLQTQMLTKKPLVSNEQHIADFLKRLQLPSVAAFVGNLERALNASLVATSVQVLRELSCEWYERSSIQGCVSRWSGVVLS